MLTTTIVILVALAAFLGGLANALLGWAKQVPPTPWDWRSFMTSGIAALVGAAGFAAAFDYSGITSVPLALLAAFIGGAGVVSITSRVGGAIAARAYRMLNLSKK
jgi:hypothetical protein